jgi:hypothetical protein
VRQDYEVLGPVYFQVSNKGLFGSHFSRLEKGYSDALRQWAESGQSSGARPGLGDVILAFAGEWSVGHSKFDRAFYIGVEELKKRASRLGADAIIFVRQDIDLDTSGFQYFYLQIYGTAVRFN